MTKSKSGHLVIPATCTHAKSVPEAKFTGCLAETCTQLKDIYWLLFTASLLNSESNFHSLSQHIFWPVSFPSPPTGHDRWLPLPEPGYSRGFFC